MATYERGVSIQSETPRFLQALTVCWSQNRSHLIINIVDHLGGAQKRIQLRQTAVFYKADADYGRRVAEGLGLDVKEVERLASLYQEERVKATAQGN